MRNGWKYLAKALLVFLPTILVVLADYTGLLSGQRYDSFAFWLFIFQGFLLVPFLVWMWIDFRRFPQNYQASCWLIKVLDVVPLVFVVLAVAYSYLQRHP